MKDLIDRKTGRMKLIDAPVGVFVFRDEFVLKTEYMTNIDGVYIPDCYILSTGEKFWGGMKSKEDFKTKYNNLDVEVIDIMPSAHLESKRQATKTSDCISRHKIIKAIDKFIPADPMKSDYTQGISVGLALATRCIEEFSQETDESSQGLVKDLISRQDAIEAVCTEIMSITDYSLTMAYEIAEEAIECLPSAQPEIIHCRDCKHHWTHRCMDSMPTEICDLNQTFYDPNIDFCSLAERRTDE